jgi:hypothetical protein
MDSKYLESLWFTMHHSDDSERQTLIIRCYLDESGTGSDSPEAVVAGLLMNRDNFLLFDVVWDELLLRHKIQPPLHMKEFGKHGRHGNLNYPERTALFSDLSKLINCYKVVSVATTLNYDQYKKNLHPKIQKQMSLYSLCFMLCLHMIHFYVEQHFPNIAYIIEQGNEYSGQILQCYNSMLRMQKENMHLHIGTLTFADKNISALQAADIIAWAVRRRASKIPVGKGFQPISDIFSTDHRQFIWEDSYLENLSNGLLKYF